MPPFWKAKCNEKGFRIPCLWFGNVDCRWTTNTQKKYNLYRFIQWHQVWNSSEERMESVLRCDQNVGAWVHLCTINFCSAKRSSYRRNDYRLPSEESMRSRFTLRINAILLPTYSQIHARPIKDKHSIYSEGRPVALNKMSWGGFGQSCASGLGCSDTGASSSGGWLVCLGSCLKVCVCVCGVELSGVCVCVRPEMCMWIIFPLWVQTLFSHYKETFSLFVVPFNAYVQAGKASHSYNMATSHLFIVNIAKRGRGARISKICTQTYL